MKEKRPGEAKKREKFVERLSREASQEGAGGNG